MWSHDSGGGGVWSHDSGGGCGHMIVGVVT